MFWAILITAIVLVYCITTGIIYQLISRITNFDNGDTQVTAALWPFSLPILTGSRIVSLIFDKRESKKDSKIEELESEIKTLKNENAGLKIARTEVKIESESEFEKWQKECLVWRKEHPTVYRS